MDNVDESRIIEMAWEDRTPFEAIDNLYGLCESEVIKMMRRQLKPSSFKLWRSRVA
ncbi:TIGR03643 family protein, partial [Photobacterium damselae subsp. damselae]